MDSKIKRARLSVNMTQVELAEKVGCSQQHIQRVESGKGCPSISTLKKMGEALKTDWRELI